MRRGKESEWPEVDSWEPQVLVCRAPTLPAIPGLTGRKWNVKRPFSLAAPPPHYEANDSSIHSTFTGHLLCACMPGPGEWGTGPE